MFTQQNAKAMAKSLRDTLANRNLSLSHSTCLEIVARQLGYADWNTLSAKLSTEERPPIRPQNADSILSAHVPDLAPNSDSEGISAAPLDEIKTDSELDGTSQTTETPAPWSACSFCGKSRKEVKSLVGGCGDWEAARQRGGPERSNVFICDECATDVAKHFANVFGTAKESSAT